MIMTMDATSAGISLQGLEVQYLVWIKSGRSPHFLLEPPELARLYSMLHDTPRIREPVYSTFAEFISISEDHFVTVAARNWLANGRPPLQLLTGDKLLVASQWVSKRTKQDTATRTAELEFIRISEEARRISEEAKALEFNQGWGARLSAPEFKRYSVVPEERPLSERIGRASEHDRALERRARDAEERRRADEQRNIQEALDEKKRAAAVQASRLAVSELTAAAADTPRRAAGDGASSADLVDVSVFAPPEARRGAEILVQVMLHSAGDVEPATTRAALIDDCAQLRGSTSLSVELRRGTRVTITLWEPRLTIEKPSQQLVWSGSLASATFLVQVPPEIDIGLLFPSVRVSIGPALIGELRFKLTLPHGQDASGRHQQRNELRPASATRYRRVFFSYSSNDRPKVLEVAQSYRAAGIDFFQDILSLEPGARWEQGLYKEIDNCDMFLLFWSEHARNSEWVGKEARYAIARRAKTGETTPDIVPLVLEGPPSPLPHDFLAHLHFDDWMRYAIAATSSAAESNAGPSSSAISRNYAPWIVALIFLAAYLGLMVWWMSR